MSEVSQTSSIADVEVVPDLTFASPNGVALGVDLYLPKTGSIPPPVIVWIHGGAWRANDRKHGPDMRRYFASRGFAMASGQREDARVTRSVTGLTWWAEFAVPLD